MYEIVGSNEEQGVELMSDAKRDYYEAIEVARKMLRDENVRYVEIAVKMTGAVVWSAIKGRQGDIYIHAE